MNTIMIYLSPSVEKEHISFFVHEGDLSHLNNVYINQWVSSEEQDQQEQLEDELYELMYKEDGSLAHTPFQTFPLERVSLADTVVITCGFLD